MVVDIRIDLDEIRGLCTEASFDRGAKYFEEGRVKIKDASSDRIEATVEGTDRYRVEVDLTNGISAICSCPYSFEGYCKHIVATLLAVRSNPLEVALMIEQRISDIEMANALLEKIQPDLLKSFLSLEMDKNPMMMARFLACFGQKGAKKSVSDYKRETADLYEELEDRGFIHYGREVDFSSLEELAEIFTENEDFLEAAKIYQALTEVIAEKMDNVDDSDGYYGGQFEEYLADFLKCIKAADLDEASKKRYIRYLFERYLERDPDYFQDDYRDALKELCSSDDDLRYWLDLQKLHLPDEIPGRDDWRGFYESRELVASHLQLLSDLGETADFYALIRKHYRSAEDLCLWYAQNLLEDGEREMALQVAKEGLTLFPHSHRGLREFLSGIFKDRSPEKYKENLLALFFDGGEWKHYEQLKEASSEDEWEDLIPQILDHFSRSSYRTKVIDIYLREEMYNEALRAVLAAKSLAVLRSYQSQLADRFPKDYFNAYRELIIPFASSRTGRSHYQEVVRILQKMKEIEGFGLELQEIVERLRRENSRKPAFIDEMSVL